MSDQEITLRNALKMEKNHRPFSYINMKKCDECNKNTNNTISTINESDDNIIIEEEKIDNPDYKVRPYGDNVQHGWIFCSKCTINGIAKKEVVRYINEKRILPLFFLFSNEYAEKYNFINENGSMEIVLNFWHDVNRVCLKSQTEYKFKDHLIVRKNEKNEYNVFVIYSNPDDMKLTKKTYLCKRVTLANLFYHNRNLYSIIKNTKNFYGKTFLFDIGYDDLSKDFQKELLKEYKNAIKSSNKTKM